MKTTKEEYYKKISDFFIFKPRIKEIKINEINNIIHNNHYDCDFIINEHKYKLSLCFNKNRTSKQIVFYDYIKYKSRPVNKTLDCEKFIYCELLNLFTNKFNKSFIDFDIIKFL